MTRAALALALTLLATPALAFDPPARATLLPGWRESDGRHIAAVRIALDPGWKTYWRAPGDGGIPPGFDWTAANLATAAVHFPVPTVFDQGGLRSIGYKDQVVLPVILTPKDPAAPIRGDLTLSIGVCEIVCVPLDVTLPVDLPVDLPAGGAPDPAIAAALRDRPATAAEAGVGPVGCEVTPIADGLRLIARIPVVAPARPDAVAVETGDPAVWVSDTEVTRDGGTLVAATDLVPGSGGAFLLDRSRLRFTILSAGTAVEVRGCG